MRKLRQVTAVVAVFVTAMFLAGASAGAAPAPSLVGEGLFTTHPLSAEEFDAQCDPGGTSTFNWSVAGVAIGPYPGTFTETGTATLGPQVFAPSLSFGNFNTGRIVTFEAQFTIVSGDTTINGTKRYTTTTPIINAGACAEFTDRLVTLGVPTPVIASGEIADFNLSPVSYQATIHTPTGTTQDQGRAQVIGGGFHFTYEGGFVIGGPSFQENFFAPAPSPVPTTITITPTADTNPVSTQHTVTVTVRDQNGQPYSGSVLFIVTGASSRTGNCTTSPTTGQCTFTYQGPTFPGADVIRGCVDTNRNGTLEPTETVCATATKLWVLPLSTLGKSTGGGRISAGLREVTFGFTFTSDAKALKGECNVVDRTSGAHIKCLDVLTYVQMGNHATIYGHATVDGTPTLYRIDIVDGGEGAGTTDVFAIQTASGYTAAGPVTSGNIQVHD